MNLLLFPSKLKNKVWLFVSVFVFLNLSPNIAFSQFESENDTYTCKLESQDCLNELNDILLNKEDNRSIYQYCEITSDNFKLCCEDLLNCGESWGQNMAQNLKKNSLSEVQNSVGDLLTCKLNNLAGLLNSLSSTQSQTCEVGVENCKIECESKLEEVTQAFKKCFFIPETITIEGILKAVENHKEPDECLKKMQEVAKKYKEQSLYKKSNLRDNLQSKDIINCETIRRGNTQKNLKNLTLNVCYQAKAQQELQQQQQGQQKQVKDIKANPKEEKYTSIDEWEERQKRHLQDAAANSGRRYEEETSNTKQGNKKANQFNQKEFDKKMATLGYGLGNDPDAKKNATNKTNSNIVALTGASLLTGAIGSNNGKNTPKRNQAINQNTEQSNISNLAGGTSSLCPVSMPEIKPIVFQSVEAPQIEPMNEQAHPPYDNYELVAGKPAGVLIEVDKTGMDKNSEFELDLRVISSDIRLTKCFHKAFDTAMEEGKQSSCSFTKDKLVNTGDFKFFPLPMKPSSSSSSYLGGGWINSSSPSIEVTLRLKKDTLGYCQKKKTFRVNITKTSNLELGFTRIHEPQGCKDYKVIPSQVWHNFSKSEEVKRYIPSTFPLADITSSIEPIKFYGSCDNTPPVKVSNLSKGLLEDIDALEKIRIKKGYHKLFAITSFDYVDYHYYHSKFSTPIPLSPSNYVIYNKLYRNSIAGFVIKPTTKNLLRGSLNIAFIREYSIVDEKKTLSFQDDTKIEILNSGTIAHELAHTLGQKREYYETKQKCKTFKGNTLEPCSKYKIPRSLDSWTLNKKQFWQFLKDKFSFMGGGESQDEIKDKWVDRETFQKTFKFLSGGNPVIPMGQTFYNKLENSSPKAFVSGFYNNQTGAFAVTKTEVYKTDLQTAFFPKKLQEDIKLPLITFQLKEKNKVLQEIKRPVFKMELRILYLDKASTTEPFPFSHVMAIFDLPADFQTKDLKTFTLTPNGKVLYSAPVPKQIKEYQIDNEAG